MICQNCKSETTHIKVIKGIEICSNCSELKENISTDGLLTRNSSRIRIESLKYEGDMLAPSRYDKSSKKVVPNEEFLKLNGVRARNFFSKEELKEKGYVKLANKIDKVKSEERAIKESFKKEVEHQGSAGKRIKQLLKD